MSGLGTPKERPQVECAEEGCSNTFTVYPENVNQEFCEDHQFQAIKEQVEGDSE